MRNPRQNAILEVYQLVLAAPCLCHRGYLRLYMALFVLILGLALRLSP